MEFGTDLEVYQPLDAAVRAHAAAGPDRLACVCLDVKGQQYASLTYRELDRRARSTAAELARRAKPGERALLMCETGPEFVVGFLGCLYAGVIAVPVPKPDRMSSGPRHRGRLEAIIADAEPVVVLGSGEDGGADGPDGAAQTEQGGGPLDPAPSGPGDPAPSGPVELAVSALWSAGGEDWADPRLPSGAPAFLQYTSGSTGDPKGAVISRRALAANIWAVTDGFALGGFGRDLKLVSWLPLYHDMGLMQLVLALGNGGTSVLMPQTAFLLKPFVWLEALSRHGAQLCSAPNFAFELCADRIKPEQLEALDLSALRHVTCGSEPVRFETAERFTARFGPAGLRPDTFEPAYGLAECTLYVSGEREPGDLAYFDLAADAAERGRVLAPQDGARARRLVSNGRVAKNLDVRIVDPETGRACPPDLIGEIWIAGPCVADGYWRKPGVNAEKFGGRLPGVSAGPFLRTGDLGFLRQGQVFVAGRRDDLVIVDGRNHHPRDLEFSVTDSHPALAGAQAAVFGYRQDGQDLVAVLVETALGVRIAAGPAAAASSATARGAIDRAEVEHAVRRAVSAEHQIGISALVLLKPGAIPRTTSGKVQRKASRQLFLEGGLNAW